MTVILDTVERERERERERELHFTKSYSFDYTCNKKR